MIRAVTFDVGGTLIEPWPSVGHVYAAVAARHGWSGLSAAALNREFKKAWTNLRAFKHTKAEWLQLVKFTFQPLIEEPVTPAFFSELYEQFSVPGSWRIYEDVVPTLKALSQSGLKLGIISNWDRRLGPLLRRLQLRDFFDEVVISCHTGQTKPSKAIFQKAASRLEIPPASVLHVGDSFTADVEGARNAGFHSVWLKRSNGKLGRKQITSLRQLKSFLHHR